MQPTIGRIVHYALTTQDVAQITAERSRTGTPGNAAQTGDTYPAVIVRVWDDNSVNLRILLDGGDPPLWAPSRTQGTEPGTWCWPPRA